MRERSLFRGSRHVLVACSGGPDSQVLLHALHALRIEHGCALTAAAVDHGLRPEAAAEARLAARLADALQVPFVALAVQVPAGPSRQGQARTARYAALLACARERGAERVAVGHTLDDQAETVLARLLRGAGIEGLGAIDPLRADGVVRPLIDCRRGEVRRYLEANGLESASDPSNVDERYLRSRIRARLLPLLTAENPRLPEQLAALSDDARAAGGLLAERTAAALARSQSRAAVLQEEPALVRRCVMKVLIEEQTGRSLDRAHLTALDRMLWNGGQVRVPGDVVVMLDAQGVLSVSPVAKRGRGARRRSDRTGNR